MLKSMVGFLMAKGHSRVDHHWGFPYKQLPVSQSSLSNAGHALEQSLAKVVNLFSLGATRYQALSLNKANTALGIFCLSFFILFPPQAIAQTLPSAPAKQVINQVQSTINTTDTPMATPVPTPTPPPPVTNFQLPHPGYITTTFSAYHPGIDLCIGLGMPIKPLANGVVSEAGYNFWGLGLMVEVDHGNGFKSLYAHMGKIYVNKGKEVSSGDLLGEVGMTGKTSGPHTHLELSYHGQKIDPRPLLPEIRNYPKEEDFITYQSATPSATLQPTPVNPSASQSAYQTPLYPTPPPEKTIPEKDRITSEKISENTLSTLLEISEASASPLPVLALAPKTKKTPPVKTKEEQELENILKMSKPAINIAPETVQLVTSSMVAEKTLEKMLTRSTMIAQPSPLPVGGRINLLSFNNPLK